MGKRQRKPLPTPRPARIDTDELARSLFLRGLASRAVIDTSPKDESHK